MRIEIRSCATVSILLASLLCSCGKKEESPPAAGPAAQAVQPAATPQPIPAPAAQPAPSVAATTPETTVIEVEKVFSGTIGGQPVVMQLSMKEESVPGRASVKGSYFIESQGPATKVTLTGTLQDGTMTMEQSFQGAVTGTFELSNNSANKSLFLGAWKSQGRVLPVKLTASAAQ